MGSIRDDDENKHDEVDEIGTATTSVHFRDAAAEELYRELWEQGDATVRASMSPGSAILANNHYNSGLIIRSLKKNPSFVERKPVICHTADLQREFVPIGCRHRLAPWPRLIAGMGMVAPLRRDGRQTLTSRTWNICMELTNIWAIGMVSAVCAIRTPIAGSIGASSPC